jgi:DNA-binding transcriptional ArsR family regulator
MSEAEVWAEQTADLYRVLANPRRLIILWALEHKELSVGQLAEVVGASLQSTSQHLRLMRERGILCSRRQGQTIYYHIEGPACQLVSSGLEIPFPQTELGIQFPGSNPKDQGDRS